MRRDGTGEITDQQQADQGKREDDAHGERLHHAQGLAIVPGEKCDAGGEACQDENQVDDDEGFDHVSLWPDPVPAGKCLVNMSNEYNRLSGLDKYRFQAGIGGTIVAFLGTGLFVALALWQLGRADEKRELQALVDARMAMPSVEYRGGALDLANMQYRKLHLRGRFENAGQVLIDNVMLEGKPGYQVITPFRLDDGRHVLVDRGWLPAGARRDQLPDVTVESKTVNIHGRADRHRSRPVVGAESPDPEGTMRWLYVDTNYYTERNGIEVPDFVIHLEPGSAQGYRRSETVYDAKVGMHIGYAIQWAAFAVIAFATWLGLSFKRREQE